MSTAAPDRYPVVVTVPVAWGDLDAFHHVNNTRYLRWFEDARIELFRTCGWWDVMTAGGPGPILAKTTCVFRRPVTYPDTVEVSAAVDELGVDRFTMRYRITSAAQQGALVAEGDARIVCFDYARGAKADLPDAIRAALRDLAVPSP